MKQVGVDGCHAGWIAVSDTVDGLTYCIHPTFEDLLDSWSSAQKILVDIPIGLPARRIPVRQCDMQARRVLGPRASSVFTPPSRSASRAQSIEVARELNLTEVHRSLSAQAWGICRKIAEVDQALLAHRRAREAVMEVHPEVCFWSLAGSAPMNHAKRTAAGQRERLQLLQRWEAHSAELLGSIMANHRRRDVQADDVLDALVARLGALGTGRWRPPWGARRGALREKWCLVGAS